MKNAKTNKAMGHVAIGMGKVAIKLGEIAVGKSSQQTEKKGTKSEPPSLPIAVVKRNYEGEANWEKAKYRQFNIKIDRETGEEFAAKLTKDGTSLVDWFRECVRSYMR